MNEQADRGMPYAIAGDAGVAAVQHAVYSEMKCVFRHQPVADVGIDGIIELLEKRRLTGQLVGCQVKSGEHYFRDSTDKGIVFRIEERHAQYWGHYSLPVIVALHNPADGAIFWQRISSDTLERTGKMWKMVVPFEQRLDANAKYLIASLFIQSPYEQRIGRLIADRQIIGAIRENHTYVAEVDDWANKSIGRYDFRILNDAGERVSSFTYLFPGLGNHIGDVLSEVYPWAYFEIDDDVYEEEERRNYEESEGTWDKEEESYFIDEDDFLGWRASLPSIRPLRDIAGEVDHYRLLINLNDLGEAFTVVDEYARQEDEA